MSQFYVGQKVVCVDAEGMYTLTQGATYTIHRFGNACGCFADHLQLVGVRLSCDSSCASCRVESGTEAAFRPDRFRPLDSLTEQIERIEQEGAPVEQELEPQYA